MMKKAAPFLYLLGILMLFSLSGCGRECTVTFDTNGGIRVSGELLQKVRRGEDASPPVIERDGYRVDGWDPDYRNIETDTVIVPVWVKVCKVTFELDGGTEAPDNTAELVQEIDVGEKPELPTVEKEGFHFVRWEPSVGTIEQDQTFTACWERAEFDDETLYEEIKSGVVEITVYDRDGDPESVGSGFFTDDEGTVLTNFHVMEGAYAAKVTLDSGKTYDVKAVLDYDADLDLCLIETDVPRNVFLSISSAEPKTGERVYAIGSSRSLSGTFTKGMVTAASRTFDDVEYIQHDSPISPGNSGGPLVNRYGEVMGVNTMSLADSQNINFAVNISELSALNPRNRTSMEDFYKETNAVYRWGARVKEFIAPAKSMEQESNDSWIASDPLTPGEWTAGAIMDSQDVDCFYVAVTSPGTITIELVPNHTNEAEELIGLVALYLGDNEIDVIDVLTESEDYSYKVELVYELNATEAGVYCIAVTHDDDYEISEPYVYLLRAG